MTFTRPTADQLNSHLESDGVVVIGTAYRVTEYSKKHTGYFIEGKDGCLYVRSGKSKLCLSTGSRMIVGLKTGRYV